MSAGAMGSVYGLCVDPGLISHTMTPLVAVKLFTGGLLPLRFMHQNGPVLGFEDPLVVVAS